MKHATKLLSPKDIFATDEFAEVLSPLVEPADEDASSVTGFIRYVELAVAYLTYHRRY